MGLFSKRPAARRATEPPTVIAQSDLTRAGRLVTAAEVLLDCSGQLQPADWRSG